MLSAIRAPVSEGGDDRVTRRGHAGSDGTPDDEWKTAPRPPWLPSEALLEEDGHPLTGLFADRATQVSLDGQFVRAVAKGHERAAKRMAVDAPADFDEAAGAEELRRAGHDDVGPAALGAALLKGGGEPFIQLLHRASSSTRPGISSNRPAHC